MHSSRRFALVAACLACSCYDEPYAEIDMSSVGEGLLAQQVGAGLTVGTDESNQLVLRRWLEQQCTITDRASARECGLHLGMECGEASSEEAVCSYAATIRTRMRNRRLPPDYVAKDTPWYRRTAYVELHVRGAEPMLIYRTTGAVDTEVQP